MYIAAGSLVTVGGAAALWPIVDSLNPNAASMSHRVKIDLSDIAKGQRQTVLFNGKPIYIAHLTDAERASIVVGARPVAAELKKEQNREWAIFVGLCTRFNILLEGQEQQMRGDYGGWFCPICVSHFDLAGSVRKGIAPRDLEVPNYAFLDQTTIEFYSRPQPNPWS